MISVKGGVGKTTLSSHLLTFFLKDKEFELIEIDDNNRSAEAFVDSTLLQDRINSLNLTKSEEKLEELVIELINNEKVIIIDAGGGNDSRKVFEMLEKNDLAKQTLFIVPYTPDFLQIQGLKDTVNLVKEHDFCVVLNSFQETKEAEVFMSGDEDLSLPSFSKSFQNFFVVPQSLFFSYAIVRYKQTIADFAEIAYQYSQEQLLESVKNLSKEEALTQYRKFKKAREARAYLEREEIQKFLKFIQGVVHD